MKKILPLLLSGVILVTSVPISTSKDSLAATKEVSIMPIKAEEPVRSISKEPSNKALESAIRAVKAKITIPKEYTEFDYYFNGSSSYADTSWNLSWRNPENSSYIQVNCDQNNHITYFNMYDYSNKGSGIPSYLKKELKATADAFIKKIAPQVSPKLEYVDAKYESIYSGTYLYSYQRVENGVSFPDNTVTVGVDSATGEVRNASIHWLYDVAVPSADTKLTKEEAAAIINKNLEMKLVYRTNYYRIYDNGSNDYEQKAFLVYEPDPGYISIDAGNGKVYLNRTEWIEKDRTNGTMEASDSVSSEKSMSDTLTEEEIKKINELEKLITKDRAIELVTGNKALYIDKSLMTYTAYLNKAYNNGKKDASYVWNVELKDARPVDYEKDKDYYRAYANATVDAENGKILSFHASIRSNYDEKNGKWKTVQIPYDREEAKVILEKFLESQIRTRFRNTKLADQREDYIAYYKNEQTPVFGGYTYQYNRYNEGVEYPYNGIYGSVDGVTGKIYSYRSNWDDTIKFESPKGAMTPEEAFEKYISKEGYHLVYEVNEINIYDPNYTKPDKYYDLSEAYSLKQEIRLVYRPDINPSYISPFTGEQLNYDGSVYSKLKPYTYKDIEDTKENREILLLADMNIGFEGEYFYPTKAITVEELAGLMEKIGYGYWNGEEDKTKVNNTPITREEIASSFIKRLGLEKMAALQGIYSTGYYDQATINSEYLGAVALAKGFGLMSADENNYFKPKDNVTRAEAVHLILNFIDVQKMGIY